MSRATARVGREQGRVSHAEGGVQGVRRARPGDPGDQEAEEFGEENAPFYFFVFSSQNDWEVKLYEIEVGEDTLHTHKMNLESAVSYFESENKKGWTPYPTYQKCLKCALKDECGHSLNVPKPQKVYY